MSSIWFAFKNVNKFRNVWTLCLITHAPTEVIYRAVECTSKACSYGRILFKLQTLQIAMHRALTTTLTFFKATTVINDEAKCYIISRAVSCVYPFLYLL